MRDKLLEKICDLENWIGTDGKRLVNWPLVVVAYFFLIVILIFSNLLAVVQMTGQIFVKQKDTNKEEVEPQIVELEQPGQLDEILANSSYVLVDFWAAWCGTCLMMKPALDAVAAKFAGKLVVVMIDSSRYADLSKEYSVAGLPSLLFFSDGNLIDRHAGALSEQHLSNWISDKLDSEAS